MPVKIKGRLRGSEGHLHRVEECCTAMIDAPELSISPAASRMRRHRQRRRDGLRCLVIELRETEIDAFQSSFENAFFPTA